MKIGPGKNRRGLSRNQGARPGSAGAHEAEAAPALGLAHPARLRYSDGRFRLPSDQAAAGQDIPRRPSSKSGPVAKKRMPPASSVPPGRDHHRRHRLQPEAVESIYAVGRPLTAAVLPDADLTGESARLAAACGLEVMLHLPLESNGNKTDPAGSGPAIREGKLRGEIRAEIDRCLARVRGAPRPQQSRGLGDDGKGGVDAPDSRDPQGAGTLFHRQPISDRGHRHPCGSRPDRSPPPPAGFFSTRNAAMRLAAGLRELFRSAKENGRAVAICHPKRVARRPGPSRRLGRILRRPPRFRLRGRRTRTRSRRQVSEADPGHDQKRAVFGLEGFPSTS